MKKDGLLAEILDAVVKHNRKKASEYKHDSILEQKKQLWYWMMNVVDEEPASGGSEAPEPEEKT